MVPAEWTRRVDEYNEREERAARERITMAYMYAKLQRTDRLPPLQTLLEPPVEVVELSPEEAERQKVLMTQALSVIDKIKARAEERKARKAAAGGR